MSFDHRDEGTPEAVWSAAEQWADVPVEGLHGVELLVVVAAHPDDESLGAAGLMAKAHSQGIAVTVVVATAGEASHPASPSHSPEQLAAIRRSELVQAVDEVAPGARIVLLGLADGGLREHVDELQRAIVAAIGGNDAALVVAPWRADAHPDHTSAGEAAARAVLAAPGARLLEYPIWGWHWATPDSVEWPWQRARTVELHATAAEAKARALGRHRSQVEPLSDERGDEPIVAPSFAAHFERPFETFFAPDDESDSAGRSSLARAYFDDFYEGKTDPWGFETRWYEERKRALTLAGLPRRRFASALELGSSIGVLTAELAARCDALLGTDIAEAPLAVARERLAGAPHVRFERRELPDEWPEGPFDLIVVSEVGYYLSRGRLESLIRRIATSLSPDGVVIACHWRHPVADYPLSGDQVHAALRRESGLERTGGYDDRDMLLDVFAPPGAPSVAQAEGLA